MKQLSNKEYDEYVALKEAKRDGRLLSADTLRFICESYHYDAQQIGQHFLNLLPGILKKVEDHRFDKFTPEEKQQYLFDERKGALDMFLENGAISQEEYDKRVQELEDRMGTLE